MKVLYLTNIPSPYRVEFFNQLGRLCDLTVLYERKYANDRDPRWLQNKASSFEPVCLPGLNIGADSGFNPVVLKWLNPNKYDIIVVGGYSTPTGMLAILYMKLLKIPYILNADGGLIKTESNKIKARMKKFFIGGASAYITTGEKGTEYLRHYGAKARVYYYPFTSVSQRDLRDKTINREEKKKIRAELSLKEETIIISAGQFIHGKGFDVLIKAAAQLNGGAGVYIIGGNPSGEYLELVNQYSLSNVHFIDFLMAPDLKKYYDAADLFVFPTRGDVWGLVINEAMASGLPVVTTDKCVAGLELVEDYKNGFIVPADDDIKLAGKINIILNDEQLRQEMAAESLKRIQSYSIENMALRHFEIFEKII